MRCTEPAVGLRTVRCTRQGRRIRLLVAASGRNVYVFTMIVWLEVLQGASITWSYDWCFALSPV